jgi:uncharacterized protein
MKYETDISEEHLNAFVDNQLDADEKSRVFEAINADEELNRDVCQLRKLHEMVGHAYEQPPAPPHRTHQTGFNSTRWGRRVAAGVLFACGGILGWVGHGQTELPNLQAMYWDKDNTFQNIELKQIAAADKQKKVLVHLNQANDEKINATLDTVERVLKAYANSHQPVDVEVVANAGGLQLLRAADSPHAQRVRELQQQYVNLTFLACKTAMDRLREEQGIDLQLLPEVDVTPSALEQILNRLRDGWVYIKV